MGQWDSDRQKDNIMRILKIIPLLLMFVYPPPSVCAPLARPTTVMADLVPIAIGSALILKGVLVGNAIAHKANDRKYENSRGKLVQSGAELSSLRLLSNQHIPPPPSNNNIPTSQSQGYIPPYQSQGYNPPPQSHGYNPPPQPHGYNPPPQSHGYNPPPQSHGYIPPPQSHDYNPPPPPPPPNNNAIPFREFVK